LLIVTVAILTYRFSIPIHTLSFRTGEAGEEPAVLSPGDNPPTTPSACTTVEERRFSAA
jgi:hypothetical protein